jgi:hypothetical protein
VAVAMLVMGCGRSPQAAPRPVPVIPGCRIDGWVQHPDARGKVPTAITFEPQANDESLRRAVAAIDPAEIESVSIENAAVSLNGLTQFPNLRGISFKGNIPLHGLPPIKSLTSVSIESGTMRAVDARALAVLPSLARLRLNIQSTDGLEAGSADLIGQLPTLQQLAVLYGPLSSADFRGLARSRRLIELELRANRLGRAELVELTGMATLQTLSLQQTSIDDESISVLDALPILSSVELRACSISDRTVQLLWRLGLEKIHLTPRQSVRLTANCLNGIEQATKLKQLVIAVEGLDEMGLKSIFALPSIEKVVLGRAPSVSPSTLETIRQNSSQVQVLLPTRID